MQANYHIDYCKASDIVFRFSPALPPSPYENFLTCRSLQQFAQLRNGSEVLLFFTQWFGNLQNLRNSLELQYYKKNTVISEKSGSLTGYQGTWILIVPGKRV